MGDPKEVNCFYEHMSWKPTSTAHKDIRLTSNIPGGDRSILLGYDEIVAMYKAIGCPNDREVKVRRALQNVEDRAMWLCDEGTVEFIKLQKKNVIGE